MEFTEIHEVDGIAAYSRTTQVWQALVHTDGVFHYSQQGVTQDRSTCDILDYEKALKDTPPGSPHKISRTSSQPIMKDIDDDDKSLDEILSDIKTTLAEKGEIAFSSPDRTPDKIKLQKNGNWSKETSQYEGDQEKSKNAKKRVSFRDFSDKNFDGKEDNDDLRIESSSRNFEKMGEDMVSKSYMEAKNLKSFLSTGIKAVPAVRFILNKSSNLYLRQGMEAII